ncbi:MAG: hypothetical protein ACI9OJ_002516, partial [Myxococcota bacterium]
MKRVQAIIATLTLIACSSALADGPYRPGSVLSRLQVHPASMALSSANKVVASYRVAVRRAGAALTGSELLNKETLTVFDRLAKAATAAQLALNKTADSVANANSANARTLRNSGADGQTLTQT